MNARDLTIALGGEWHGHQGHAPCPVCQPERRRDQRALSIRDGDTRLLVHCHKGGCDPRQILGGHQLRPASISCNRINAGKSVIAQRIWDQSVPIANTVAERYLSARGITCCPLPPTLRFNSGCWHGPTSTRHPALVALIEGGEGFAVHRTFLRPDGTGKADLRGGNKMMLGKARGGAVRLTEADGPLVIAEGIETALSLASGLLRAPATVWAALSTSGMRALNLPPPARLTIASDGDDAGRSAAHDLAARAAALGWAVNMLPAPAGSDWNDVLTEGNNHG